MSRVPRAGALLLFLGIGVAVVAAAAALPARSPAAEAGPRADASLFQLDVRLEASGGGDRSLRSLAGRPIVMAMFYSSCTSVCPLLTLEMQRIESALRGSEREREREQVQFVMVSLDAERDSPANLDAFASEHHLDRPRWLIAHASAKDVRTLAAALGVRYRQLPDKTFSHSSIVTLLDAEGVPRARLQVPSADQSEFLARLRALL